MDDDWGYPYFRKPPYVAVQFTHPAPPNSQLATSLNMVYCSLDKLSPIIPQSTILGLKRYLYEWKTLVLLLFTPKQLGSMDVHTQNICFVIFARVKIWCMDWWPPLLSVVTHPNLSSQMPMSLDWFKGSTRIYRKPSHFQGNTMPIGSMYGIYAKMTGVYWWQMLPYMAYIRILWGMDVQKSTLQSRQSSTGFKSLATSESWLSVFNWLTIAPANLGISTVFRILFQDIMFSNMISSPTRIHRK